MHDIIKSMFFILYFSVSNFLHTLKPNHFQDFAFHHHICLMICTQKIWDVNASFNNLPPFPFIHFLRYRNSGSNPRSNYHPGLPSVCSHEHVEHQTVPRKCLNHVVLQNEVTAQNLRWCPKCYTRQSCQEIGHFLHLQHTGLEASP